MEMNATIIAQLVNLLLAASFLYGIIAMIRFFKDLKNRIINLEKRLDDLSNSKKE